MGNKKEHMIVIAVTEWEYNHQISPDSVSLPLCLQSSYEECGAAVQPGSKGSSDPQQCQYWYTFPESAVFMVPPVYTLSNFLLVSPEQQHEKS